MDEIISYKMCAVKVRNAKLRNYLKSKNRAIFLQSNGKLYLFYSSFKDRAQSFLYRSQTIRNEKR